MDILIYGTINSMALALMALGFALVYGISRVPNFAHGALYVISGFVTWGFLRALGVNYLLSIFLTMIIIGVVGALIYQFILIHAEYINYRSQLTQDMLLICRSMITTILKIDRGLL